MIDLQFQQLTVGNFKSFIGKPSTVDLAGRGLVFVRGRNDLEPRLGANDVGKTTLFDAITWCLYGRTVDNQRNPDIAPWTGNSGNPSVRVALQRDGEASTIARSTSPNRLTINDQEVRQDEVDRLLGFNFEVFTHTILQGQGQPLFLDLTPERQMDLFVQTLDLDRWEVRSEEARTKVWDLDSKLTTTKGEIAGHEATLVQIKDLMKTAEYDAGHWQKAHSAKTADHTKEIKTLRAKQERLQVKRDSANLAYDSAMTELRALDSKTDKTRRLMQLAAEDVHKGKLELENRREKYSTVQEEIRSLSKAKVCPTCGQSIQRLDLAPHKRELAARLSALASLIESQAASCKELDKVYQLLRQQVEDATAHRTKFQAKADNAQQEFDQVADVVVELTTKVRQLEGLQRERADDVNPYREQIMALRTKRNELTEKLEDLDNQVIILERRIRRTQFWVKAFKDIRLYIIEEVLQELELVTNLMLPESGLEGWKINFAIERETKSGSVKRGLNVTVLSPKNKKPVKWAVWGGGVGQRMRVVSTLALSDVLLAHAGVTTNLQVLDEPTRHLSVEGVQDLCEFLSARAEQQDKTIFYVDHLAVESAHFDKVLTVVKTDNGSKIRT